MISFSGDGKLNLLSKNITNKEARKNKKNLIIFFLNGGLFDIGLLL